MLLHHTETHHPTLAKVHTHYNHMHTKGVQSQWGPWPLELGVSSMTSPQHHKEKQEGGGIVQAK